MKKQLLKNLCMAFLGITGVSSIVNAQTNPHWLASVSGTGALFSGEYRGNHLAIDVAGNTYTTGTYRDNTSSYSAGETGKDGTPGVTLTGTGGNEKIFIAKTNQSGTISWTLGLRTSSTTADATTCTIAVSDVTDAVYVGGYFNGNINTFSGTPSYAGNIALTSGTDGLVIKLSKAGERQWHKVFGGSGNQEVHGVTTDNQGNLIVVGTYATTLTIDGDVAITAPTGGGIDAFIAKFTQNGDILFINSIGGTGTENIWGVATDIDNDIYVIGSAAFGTETAPVTVSITRNPNGTPISTPLPGAIGTNTYIAKFDKNGAVSWGKIVTSTGSNVGQGIAVDYESHINNRGVYVTGNVVNNGTANVNFSGVEVSLDGGTYNNPYVAKFSAEKGEGIWAKAFKVTGTSGAGYVVAVNPNKDIFAAGYSRTIEIDNIERVASSDDGFIVKMNSENGAVVDRKFIAATSGTDRVLGLAATNSAVYATGLAGSLAKDPLLTENFAGTGFDIYTRGGSWDCFILKWNSTTLPVSLTEFKGSKTSLGNLLSWATQSETDNQYFELERSGDGLNFISIKSVSGAGTSTTKRSYSYLDTNPLAGVNYYRLKQVDGNGAFSYSKEIIAINNQLEAEELKAYPNPGTGLVTVQLPSESADAEINVYNQAGKLIESYTNVLGNNHTVDISKQPTGIYYIQIVEKGKSKLIKYIKQ